MAEETPSYPPPIVGENEIYYTWPDFPKAPDGVTIVPFKDFKPVGIPNPRTNPDEIEYDGAGIPTCKLPINREDNPEHLPGRRRRKKKKKAGREGTGLNDELPIRNGRRLTWYEDWMEREYLLIPDFIDPEDALFHRYIHVIQMFWHGRRKTDDLASIFDHFSLFSGGMERGIQPAKTRRQKALEKDDDDNDDDYSDDETVVDKPKSGGKDTETSHPVESKTDKELDEIEASEKEAFERRVEDEHASRMERLESFFKAPVFSTKVFLSSHFRDKGLIWSGQKLDMAPRLLEFFYEYMIRSNAFQEHHPKLRMAVKLLEIAKIELPATGKIGFAIPELFGRACRETWGVQAPGFDVFGWDTSSPSPPNPVTPPEPEHKRDAGVMDVEELGQRMEEDREGTGENLGWGSAQGGWGDEFAVPSSTNKMDEDDPWKPEKEEDALASWAGQGPPLSFMSVFGPLAQLLVHTHKPVLLEQSLRSIGTICLPGDFDGSEEVPGLGMVTLHPWYAPEESLLEPPEILGLPPADDKRRPTKVTEDDIPKSIHVLLDPSAMELMVKDMILGGVFVKIAPMEKEDGREWWYIEKLMQVLPSYYAEHHGLYINELFMGGGGGGDDD